MYSKISKEFKEAVKSNAVTASAKLTVYNDDGTTTLIDGNNLKTLKITDNCYTEGQIIGTACCKELDATVINNNYDLADKELDVEVGVEVPYATDEKTIIDKDISITNVVPNGYDYEVRGESTQETRSGKNYVNVTAGTQTKNGVTFTVNTDKSITINGTNTGTSTLFFRIGDNIILSAGTYTLSNGNSDGSEGTFLFYDDNSNFDRYPQSTKTFTQKVEIYPYIRVGAGVTVNNQTVYPMIEEGSTVTEYEAYGASPSPDFPSGIESVSGKNLFDLSTISEKTYLASADGSTETSSVSNVSDYIEVKANKTYTLSFDYDGLASSSNRAYCFYDKNKTFVSGGDYYPPYKKATMTPDQDGYIRFCYDINCNNVQFQRDSTVTDYVPYKNIAIRSTNKNLLNAPSNFELTGSKVLIPFYLKAGTYVLSVENIETTGTTASLISFNTAAGTTDYYYLSNSSKSKTVTFKSDVMYYNIYSQNSYSASIGVTAVFTNLMIRHENSSAEYEPHVSNQANITLLHPLRSLPNGVYDRIYKKDGKWYDEKKIDSFILDGSADEKIGYDTKNTAFYYYGHENLAKKPVNNSIVCVMSNYFKGETANNCVKNSYNHCLGFNTNSNLWIRYNELTTVADFKAWLSTNNTEVLYELVTPITTEITDNETIQALEDMTLYDGVTNIASDAPIKLTYKEKKAGTSIEYIPYGRYKVKKYDDTKSNNTYRIIAYDYMDRLNSVFEEFEASLYPMTLQTFYEKLAQQYGVTVKIQDLPNKDFIISAPPYFEGMSGRNVLKATAQLFGSFAKFNRSNRIQMYLQEETDEKISRNEMNSQLVIDNEYGPVNVLVLSLSQVTGENVTVRDETSIQQYGENIIEIQDNPFIYTQALKEQVKDGIFNRIKGFRYIPTTFKYKAKLYIDCGDLIQIQKMKEDDYVNSIILNQYIEIPSTRQSKCENKALTKTEVKNQFVPDEKERLKRAEISIDKQGVKIEQVTEKTDKNTNDIASVTTTQTEQGLNIDALITKTSKIDEDGNATTVKTETGFTFDVNGLNIAEKKDGSNIGFNAQITPTGTHYKDGDSIIGEYTKDGSKQKNLELFGIYSYGMENIDDTAMFISQLYTDENGEECVGHFYNGE